MNPRPLAAARRALLAASRPLEESELLLPEEAQGRVTAEPVCARSSVPHYAGAAMDGIAVRAADTADAAEARPLELVRGEPPGEERPFSFVDTGNALPPWADAVVMIERVKPVEREPAAAYAARPAAAGRVEIAAPASPWQHVRLVGEDIVEAAPLLPRGHRIRPVDVGALLAAGIDRVAVRPRPVVAILPTGDELVEPGEARRPGRIVEFNSRMIAAFVREWGGQPVRLAPVGDNLDAIRSRLQLAARAADVVCVIAGSSAGEHDFTVEALGSLGEILAHGIDVMPGRPAIAAALASALPSGEAARASVALGIPGYPVSAAVVCRELLEPLLAHIVGAAPEGLPIVRGFLVGDLTSRPGQEEVVRVNLGAVGGRTVVCPLPRGAGAITTMVRADGQIRLPVGCEGARAGDEVAVELLRPFGEAAGTILLAGLDDPLLAPLEDALRAVAPQRRLAVRSVDQASALRAVLAGTAHAAVAAASATAGGAGGADALGAALPVGAARVVPLAARSSGLVVARGNPLGIRGPADLARADVRMVPEVTRGGARLAMRGLGGGAAASGAGAGPRGAEERQELTPMAVAAAVQSGLADVGFGVEAAAHALELDFVPLQREVVALVLREDFARDDGGRALLAAIAAERFRAAAARLPGCAPCGAER